MANVYVAKVDAIIDDVEHGLTRLRKNVTRVVEGHGLLERYPDCFEPADVNAHFKVRSAKAEPKVPSRAKKSAEASESDSSAE